MKKTISVFLLLFFSALAFSQNETNTVDVNAITNFQKISIALSLFSIILIAFGFYLTVYSLRRNHDWNRRSKTQDAMSIFVDSGRIGDLEILNSAFNYSQSNEPILLDNIDNKTKENPKLLQILFVRLNIFEMFAIGINQGVYDELIVKHSTAVIMTRAYFRFKNFINRQREHNSDFCTSLERLVLNWEASDKKNTNRKKTG